MRVEVARLKLCKREVKAFRKLRPLGGKLAGVITRMRSPARRRMSSFMYSPAMIVFPAPGSSASRKRVRGSRRKQS